VTVGLIDYRAGNLASVAKAFRYLGAEPRVLSSPAEVANAGALVIPGVGHFAATAALADDWRLAIRARIEGGTAVLGICLGMQWLYDGSDEATHLTGLGWFEGRCRRLGGTVKVPHVGWNVIERTGRESEWLAGVASGASAYFTHAFAAPVTADTSATCTHGESFAAVVERGRVFGVQFHPEKSGRAGLGQLANFLAIASRGA